MLFLSYSKTFWNEFKTVVRQKKCLYLELEKICKIIVLCHLCVKYRRVLVCHMRQDMLAMCLVQLRPQ